MPLSPYSHQTSYIIGRVTDVASDDPSDQRNENDPDNGSSNATTSLTFRFDVYHRIQFKVKPLHQREILVEELQALINSKLFEVDILHSTDCNCNITTFKIVDRMLSELEIEHRFHDVLIENICPLVYPFLMEAMASSGHKRMTQQMEILITEVFVHDEEETTAMAEMESAADYEQQRGFALVPASRSAVEKLKRQRVNGEEFTAITSCRICLEDMEIGSEVTTMPCSHVYHSSCVNSWLQIHHLCPLCRFQMPV